MPLLINKSLTKFSSLAIWAIEESTEDLLKLLKGDRQYARIPNTGYRLPAMALPLRQRQRLCTLLLLKSLCGNVPVLYYNSNGKPYLANHPAHISVSHSGKFVAVIVNGKTDTGVDLQTYGLKIVRIKEKFLHPDELDVLMAISGQHIKKEFINKLHIYWCAKEALYKLYGKGGLIFRRDLLIHPFDLKSNGRIQGTISNEGKKNHYFMRYEIEDEYVLVYIKP